MKRLELIHSFHRAKEIIQSRNKLDLEVYRDPI